MNKEKRDENVCKEILEIFRKHKIPIVESLGHLEVIKHLVIKNVFSKKEK